jgi:hypothetical protein
MNGSDIFKHAVRLMAESVTNLLVAHDISIDDINLMIPHQANIRILNKLGTDSGFPKKKFSSMLINMVIPPLPASRLLLMKPTGRVGWYVVILSCCVPLAADSPGVRCSCGGKS